MVKALKKKARGLATVEMAIVLPLLLLVTMGAIRYGHLFLIAQEVTNATRNGARRAIVPDATNADVEGIVRELMSAAGLDEGDYTLTLPGDVHSIPMGQSVTVQITVPVANVDVLHVPLFTNLEPNNGNWILGATVTMAKEGF